MVLFLLELYYFLVVVLSSPSSFLYHQCSEMFSPPSRRSCCCISVLLCFVCGSCPVPCCCVQGQGPFPIVCCHMEASTNTEISLSSCCSLTFSGTQLALNAEIIIIQITQANSVSSLCSEGELRRGGRVLWSARGDAAVGDLTQKNTSVVGLTLPQILYISLSVSVRSW